MAAIILRGGPVAEDLMRRTSGLVEALARRDLCPCLGVLEATGRPEGERFVRSLDSLCSQAGMAFKVARFPGEGAGRDLLECLRDWGQDPRVHAIAVATPLSSDYQDLQLHWRIPVDKDVEGTHPFNLGRLVAGCPGILPVAAGACLELLRYYQIPLAGRRAVLVGRSPSVGLPLGLALQGAQATVTFCHSRTRDLGHQTRQAELLVVAVGSPGLIQASMIAPGAVVVDFGTTPGEGEQILGDVDSAGVRMVASAYAPSPGGAGLVVPAMLLNAAAECCRQQAGATGIPTRRAELA